MQNATLVFDLDGTVVDTAPDLVAATYHALAELGLPLVPAETLRNAIGFGARHMIIAALREHGLALPGPDIDRLLERFLGHYEQNIARESRPFEGAAAVLGHLRSRGARLAICTNKRAGLSNRLLAELGLGGLFAAVAGRDTFAVHKPHPGHLTGVVALAGGDMGSVVMIGDTSVDVATARAAGVPVVACSFGYSDVPIEALAADAVIASYGELEVAIGSVLANTGATASG